LTEIDLPAKLPGKEAHLKLAPEPRVITLIKEQAPPATAKESAVLVLLTPPGDIRDREVGEWRVLFIKRNTYYGVHSGQIAFPGGKCEECDIDYHATACREAHEEMGIERNKIRIIGSLTKLYVPPSNFTIYPTVAVNKSVKEFTPDPREVMEYMQVPLKYFDPAKAERCRVQAGPYEWVHAPGYRIEENIIWGATAMIVAELYQSVI
jgi:8-oxo-dGTP pyrophosphatase MutT (NUDIX family)